MSVGDLLIHFEFVCLMLADCAPSLSVLCDWIRCVFAQFLLGHPGIGASDIPLFHALLLNGDPHAMRKTRFWCLQYLHRALQVKRCGGSVRCCSGGDFRSHA